jgi:hypothetical protein
MSDRSSVGLYFTDAPASGREIQTLSIDAPAGSASASSSSSSSSSSATDSPKPVTLTSRLAGPSRVLAFRPTFDQQYSNVDIHAVTPSGGHVKLLRLAAPRPEWRRRYWLQNPIELPSGSTIEMTATPAAPDPDARKIPVHYPLHVALDFVPE